ncbi:unnamed protein product [Protopolystoma xenopodis]|uniref:SRCR domain-containing protein n=1 Tax=Protopolystoma xenopodis TaxID=117903 RepID=A0A448XPV9_9PLAT|nr:unnamed protein product [Protopolystoma xenopodis]
MCKQSGLGGADRIFSVSPETLEEFNLPAINFWKRCLGNESRINDCASVRYIPCNREQEISLIQCTKLLPDLTIDMESLVSNIYIQTLPLFYLSCALEERCVEYNGSGKVNWWERRYLLRFSTVIRNIGLKEFLPAWKSDRWEWHQCHQHYHSMSNFAEYEIYHFENRSNRTTIRGFDYKIASSHKASFCLEDSMCKANLQPNFKCSESRNAKGTQGLSPGCSDAYMHDIDCQWIDITKLINNGTIRSNDVYVLRVVVNPSGILVGEEDYLNNGISCKLYINSLKPYVNQCHFVHPTIIW